MNEPFGPTARNPWNPRPFWCVLRAAPFGPPVGAPSRASPGRCGTSRRPETPVTFACCERVRPPGCFEPARDDALIVRDRGHRPPLATVLRAEGRRPHAARASRRGGGHASVNRAVPSWCRLSPESRPSFSCRARTSPRSTAAEVWRGSGHRRHAERTADAVGRCPPRGREFDDHRGLQWMQSPPSSAASCGGGRENARAQRAGDGGAGCYAQRRWNSRVAACSGASGSSEAPGATPTARRPTGRSVPRWRRRAAVPAKATPPLA